MDILLQKLTQRMQPHNGQVINAEVWAEAHDYHYHHQRAHLLFGHGAGIITGLGVEVEANGKRVWIEPGMAIDGQGRVIILDRDSKDRSSTLLVGTEQAGLKYIYLEGDEERVTGQVSDSKRIYVRGGYRLMEAFTLPPAAVELARIRITHSGQPIRAALDWAQPNSHELDLRFRRQVGTHVPITVAGAIVYLGQQTGQHLPKYGRQAKHLARALSHLTRYQVWLDDDLPIAELKSYQLIYLIEQGGHVLDSALYGDILMTHLENGGVIFIESYQPDSPLYAFLVGQGLEFKSEPDEVLLTEPFLFSAPPAGAHVSGSQLRFAPGVIHSICDFGRLWQRRPDQPREAIRSATEWAANIVSYAVSRRRSG